MKTCGCIPPAWSCYAITLIAAGGLYSASGGKPPVRAVDSRPEQAQVRMLTQPTNLISKERNGLHGESLTGSEFQVERGGIVRGSPYSRRVAFVFTAHEFAEGGDTILNELAKRKAKASFFLTGTFLTSASFGPLIDRIRNERHYLGPHSDKHLLYCSWDAERKTLVSSQQFKSDLEQNLKKIAQVGVELPRVHYFLPPYEHYNQEIVQWARELGLTLINFTPGTRSTADYTGEGDTNFITSQTIFDSIIRREQKDPQGLNGFLLLLHLGAGPGRTDKFHTRFADLLDYLQRKDYQFVRVDELLGSTRVLVAPEPPPIKKENAS